MDDPLLQPPSPEFHPSSSTIQLTFVAGTIMNILAVYGSAYGQAEMVVQRLAAALERHGHSVTVHKGNAVPPEVSVRDYDAFILGASIIAGHYQKYVVEFAQRHVALLNERPSVFVSVNGTLPSDVSEWQAASKRYVTQFAAQTGWRPRWTLTVSGALRYTRYGFITRFVMRMISRRRGGPTDTSRDYEFTDWNAVDRFGADLSDALSRDPNAAASDGVPASLAQR
jgi:menaquinone-dependent protoporphyrinogen oxidase